VGYTPALSTAVWLGYADAPRQMQNIKGVSKVYGGTIPAQAWGDFMEKAMDGVPTPDFPPPGPLVAPAVASLGPGGRRTPVPPPATGPFVAVETPRPVPTTRPTTTVPQSPQITRPTVPPFTPPTIPGAGSGGSPPL